MLPLALAATLVGFVLLVLGLITGTVWLAIACIVICLVGLGFLIADIVSGRGKTDDRELSDYLTSTSGRESAPDVGFADDDERATSSPPARPTALRPGPGGTDASPPPGRSLAGSPFVGDPLVGTGRSRPTDPFVDDTEVTGRIPIVSDGAYPTSRRPMPSSPATPPATGPSPATGPTPVTGPTPAAASAPPGDQSLDDYLRSIGAPPPPPAPSPSGTSPSPSAAPAGSSSLTPAPSTWRPNSAPNPPYPAPARHSNPAPTHHAKRDFDPLDPNWHPPREDD